MNAHLTVLASLGAAILLSPEILILGLIMASDRRAPKLVAWMYAIGAAVGLAVGLVIGFVVAPEAAPAAAEAKPAHPNWGEFIVRALIAGALFWIGAQRLVHAWRAAPIEGVDEGESKHGVVAKVKGWFASKFGGGADLSTSRRCVRSFALGFAVNGLHPKSVAVAIAAGHQAMQVTEAEARTLGIAVFSAIARVPAVAPAVIETAHSGACASMKESTERFMKKNGRWMSAAILLAAAGYVAWNAWKNMP
jgi:threonine/homoserine/homoserine lactone efflux protein